MGLQPFDFPKRSDMHVKFPLKRDINKSLCSSTHINSHCIRLALDLFNMGNCIDHLFFSPPQEKIKVLIFNGGEEEFMASTPVKQITSCPYHDYRLMHLAQPHSPLPSDSELISGEVYYLMPHFTTPSSPPVSQIMVGEDGYGGHSIKVVVTKKQLKELLLRNGAEEFSAGVMESSQVGEGCRKWQPTLATIPELQIC